MFVAEKASINIVNTFPITYVCKYLCDTNLFNMAVLKIRSDIQTQDEKDFLELWGMTGGVTYNDIADFCDNIPDGKATLI